MERPDERAVGVIGLGIIGTRVAAGLRAAGLDTYVWSRSPKAVPGFLGSAAEVVRRAGLVQVFVSNDEAVREVLAGMAGALTPGHLVMVHATVAPRTMKEGAVLVRSRGAGFLEAPFTGSREAAAGGNLSYYVCGREADLEAGREVLGVSGAEVSYFGEEIGTASALKLATNLLSAATVQALAEAVALVRALKIDIGYLERAFEVNAGASPLVKMKLPAIVEGNFSPHFSVRNMLKDARLAAGLAGVAGLELGALGAALAGLERAEAGGRGEEDYSAVAKNY
jgi:3-hydroxyisobutyrate dehydrogenase-like beta-hydroxyacid dehydrogenase